MAEFGSGAMKANWIRIGKLMEAEDAEEAKKDKEIMDFDVPILATIIGLPLPRGPESTPTPERNEPTIEALIDQLDQGILPFMNGQRYVLEVAALSNVTIDFVKKVVKELLPKKVVYMVPKLNLDDYYCGKLRLSLLAFDEELQKMCIKFITNRPYGPKGTATISEVTEVLSGLQLECMTLNELSLKHAHIIKPTFDFKRLITFAVLHGLVLNLGQNPAII